MDRDTGAAVTPTTTDIPIEVPMVDTRALPVITDEATD